MPRLPDFDPAEAAEHLESLARRHRVRVTWILDWTKAEAFPEAREVVCPVVRTPADYLIGLHELGHVVSADARRHHARAETSVYDAIAAEGTAWAWATAAAHPEIAASARASDWRVVDSAFRSHLRWAAVTDAA